MLLLDSETDLQSVGESDPGAPASGVLYLEKKKMIARRASPHSLLKSPTPMPIQNEKPIKISNAGVKKYSSPAPTKRLNHQPVMLN